MNCMVEFAKNLWNLNRLNSIYYCFSSQKLNLFWFWRGSGKQKSILTWGPCENAKHVLRGGPSRTNPPPNPTISHGGPTMPTKIATVRGAFTPPRPHAGGGRLITFKCPGVPLPKNPSDASDHHPCLFVNDCQEATSTWWQLETPSFGVANGLNLSWKS